MVPSMSSYAASWWLSVIGSSLTKRPLQFNFPSLAESLDAILKSTNLIMIALQASKSRSHRLVTLLKKFAFELVTYSNVLINILLLKNLFSENVHRIC